MKKIIIIFLSYLSLTFNTIVFAIENNNTNILVDCAGGYRSALAAKSLLDIGFKNVYNLGGFQEWVEAGGEIQANI